MLSMYTAHKEYNSNIIVRYSIHKNRNMENDFNFFCHKDYNVRYKKNVMCEWNDIGKKEFYFVVGNSSLEVIYNNDEDYDIVLEIINDLGYSKYLE